MKLKIFGKKGIKFSVEGRPPRKSSWGTDEAVLIAELRLKALESLRKAGLSCFSGPVKLELVMYAPNIMNIENKQTYVGDLDTFVAGICESLQPAPINPDLIIDPIFDCRNDIGPKIPLIINDDSQVVSIIARKIESEKPHYTVIITSEDS